MVYPEYVIKRDGSLARFDPERIKYAMKRAMLAVNKYDEKKLDKILEYVLKVIEEKYDGKQNPKVEEIQDIVELALMKFDEYEVAKAYITYRKEKERIRREKIAILGEFYDEKVAKKFSLNSIRLMANRYLLKNEDGSLREGPKQMFERVAMLVVIPDILYDPRVFDKEGKQNIWETEKFDAERYENKIGLGKIEEDKYKVYWNRYHLERMKALYDELNKQGKMKMSWREFLKKLENGEFDEYYEKFLEYFELMASKKFMPNSPTLFNAGARLGQLSACFVLDIEDDMASIMETAKEAAIIFKSGGGIGINYSKLRPEGDIVASTTGVASGPVSFMKIIDTVTDVVKQGGKRRGANMGILEVWHPDIEKFIHVKETEGVLENFNISVMITPEFWEYYEKDEDFPLVNPRNGKVWSTINPRKFFSELAYIAWKSADPGVLFMDNINKRNVMKHSKGMIRSTNPCGEEPLYPYESCNLGSINLYAFIKEDEQHNRYFDWKDFERTIRIAYRFLDNVIDVNKYPLEKIEKQTKAHRKIGLGLMGLADMFFALKIPYNSEEGFELMKKVAEFLTYHAMDESVNRAIERGVFPDYELSEYKNGEIPLEGFYHKEEWNLDWEKLKNRIVENGIRNLEVTTIAPTGSISMLSDTSSGIEPQFALVFEKRVVAGEYYYVDEELKRQLIENGLWNEEILKKISDNGGSLQGIKEIPEELRKVFVTAMDIPWWDHVRAQAVLQLWITTSISKTINMPSWIEPEDVEKAYLFAYKTGCKGITIYRDGSKSRQVIYIPGEKQKSRIFEVMELVKNKTLAIMDAMGIKPPRWLFQEVKEKSDEIREQEALPKLNLKITMNKIENEAKNIGRERCPVCGNDKLIYQSGCVTCPQCGWSECVIA